MSQFIDFTLPSTVPGRTLHGFRCVPEGQVRAVLQLSHGMVHPSAPRRTTAILPSRTATAPYWPTCTP